MSLRPTKFPEWATVPEIDGVTGNPNKLEPTPEFKASGLKYRQPLARQYINYELDLIDQWLKYLDEQVSAPTPIPNILDSVYPVGSVHFSTNSANPATYFGIGTWNAVSQGRAVFGVNPTDVNFNTARKTGGSSGHTHSGQNTGTAALTYRTFDEPDRITVTEFQASSSVSPIDQGIPLFIPWEDKDYLSVGFTSPEGDMEYQVVEGLVDRQELALAISATPSLDTQKVTFNVTGRPGFATKGITKIGVINLNNFIQEYQVVAFYDYNNPNDTSKRGVWIVDIRANEWGAKIYNVKRKRRVVTSDLTSSTSVSESPSTKQIRNVVDHQHTNLVSTSANHLNPYFCLYVWERVA